MLDPKVWSKNETLYPLQHTATHRETQQHTAAHHSTPQHTAAHRRHFRRPSLHHAHYHLKKNGGSYGISEGWSRIISGSQKPPTPAPFANVHCDVP
mmetsp:Transcript_116906/g.203466  ORF Transcript_116906/g.203466 Transcript_116906/m.203466 type:complete len:96 (-) Transcript_116906:144-431(-)